MTNYPKVIRGRGSLKKLPELTSKLGIRHPLIVGSANLTGKLLRNAPDLLSSPVFQDYHANPDLQDTKQGAEMFLREACDGLISIGGGSCMDTAKAIKARMNAKGEDELKQSLLESRRDIPHIAIPGTAGTGSEATQTAVMYVNGTKLSLSHPSLRPEGVLLDSELLDTLPMHHKKASALDALAQGIESYWSRESCEDSRVHAFLAVIGVLDNLKAYMNGDPHAADEMMDAAFQSGKAIQITRTTAAHAMSYRLTKTLGIAHGHACMLTLPVLWEMMMEHESMRETLNDLSRKIRLGDPLLVPRLLKGILYDLEIEIPPMPDAAALDDLANSVNPERLKNHPVEMTRDEIREVYRKAFVPLSVNERKVCIDIWRYYGR